MSRAVSRLAGLLPPPLRRTASGLWLDVRSLPARLSDPGRRGEPWQSLHNVGGGDYARQGREVQALLRERAGLTPRSRVLDIGCGSGRVAGPLAAFLAPEGGYLGFDVSPRAVALCRRRFARLRPDFRFETADVANTEYRSRAAGREDAYRFPVENGSVDLAFATSVFSHMVLPSIRHYLAEAARALRPGGCMLFTAYALTPPRVQALDRGEGALAFRAWDGRARVVDLRSPERAIAHPLEDLTAAVGDAGLDLRGEPAFGNWLGPATYGGGQDLFVAAKPVET